MLVVLVRNVRPQYRTRTNEQFQSLFREANFAFLQAFAFNPWSPEAVLRYASLLLQFNRIDDALLVRRNQPQIRSLQRPGFRRCQ